MRVVCIIGYIMTKPSNFILNSDYLSIAQTSSNTFTAYFGGGTLPGNYGYTEQGRDFTIGSQKGSIDRILISKDGGRYQVCSYMNLSPSETIFGFVRVNRTSSSNVRVQFVLENYSPDSASYPSMTFTIRISSFKPPNIL